MQDTGNASQYLQELPAALKNFEAKRGFPFDQQAIQGLFAAADFLGVTSYPQTNPNFTAQQLETATDQFSKEMSLFGVNVSDLNVAKVGHERASELQCRIMEHLVLVSTVSLY